MIEYVWCDGDLTGPPVSSVSARPVLSGLRATVAEEIALPMEQRGVPRDEMVRRVTGIARALGISHLLARNPARLSGGETRLTAIASLIASDEPEIGLIAPTAGLAKHVVDRVTVLCESIPQTVYWVDFTDRPRALPGPVRPTAPRTVRDGVPLTPGGVTRLAGPNGVGKSTALRKLAAGLQSPLSMQFPEAQLILARRAGAPHPLDLSLGDQRVLSVKLATTPSFLLVDEPDAGLGPAHWEELHAHFARALAAGAAIVMACHDERFATDVATYACVETVTLSRQP